MSLWIIRVIGPSGRETYLFRGREVENRDTATIYSSPSAARKAREQYWQKLNSTCIVTPVMVLENLHDPETQEA